MRDETISGGRGSIDSACMQCADSKQEHPPCSVAGVCMPVVSDVTLVPQLIIPGVNKA